MVVIMVATNYKMKERTRRPPREREQEEKREEEVENLINFLFLLHQSFQSLTTPGGGQLCDNGGEGDQCEAAQRRR